VTSLPENMIVPTLGGSKPAIARSVVDFPAPLAPIKAKAEANGAGDFSNLWAGQAARLTAMRAKHLPAKDLTLALAEDALARIAALSG